jgi:nucleoside-diphosphate-sugar epimerase
VAVRVLLSGASGFIGSHLARLLVTSGESVTAVIKPATSQWRIADIAPQLDIVRCDIADREYLLPRLRAAVPDVCIHLAWHGWSGPSATAEENLSSLASSLEFLRCVADAGCRRFVGVGTCFEYEMGGGVLAESTPCTPADLYGVSKHSLWMAARALSSLTGLQVAWARVFLVYGPSDDERRLVPSVTLSMIRGEAARSTAGEQVRDVLHVEDAASALWAIARSGYTGAVNVASGVPVKVADIARQIGAAAGRPDLLQLGALPYRASDPPVLVADTTILRTVIGWAPTYDLAAGLAQTVAWWRARELSRRGVVG